eukprot:2426312-Lingulodinium_polyedra.AAC.1
MPRGPAAAEGLGRRGGPAREATRLVAAHGVPRLGSWPRARDVATRVSTWSSGNPNCSAAELVWEFAVELEAAEAAGEAVAGVALDWSK